MRFVCDRDTMHATLVYLARFARPFAKLANGIYLETTDEGIVLRTVSSIIGIEVFIPAPTTETGAAMVDGSLLASCMKTLGSGDVKVSGKKRLTIAQGSQKRRIGTANPEDAIPFPTLTVKDSVEVDAKRLLQSISYVSFARAKNDVNRPLLECVFLDFANLGLAMATDSIRIALANLDGNEPISVLLPPVAIMALDKGLALSSSETVKLSSTTSGWIEAEMGNIKIAAGTPYGEYPTRAAELGASLLNREETATAKLIKADVLPTLEMAAILTKVPEAIGASRGVQVTIEEGRIKLECAATSSEGLTDEIAVETSGNETVTLFATQLLQAVKHAPDDTIMLHVAGPLEPVLFTCETARWMLAIAPVVTRVPTQKVEEEEDDEGDW